MLIEIAFLWLFYTKTYAKHNSTIFSYFAHLRGLLANKEDLLKE